MIIVSRCESLFGLGCKASTSMLALIKQKTEFINLKILLMAKTINQRMTVKMEGDFVVFIIGMRINRWWKFHKWLPVVLAMPRMLKELSHKPESGFLGAEVGLAAIVQYWKSF